MRDYDNEEYFSNRPEGVRGLFLLTDRVHISRRIPGGEPVRLFLGPGKIILQANQQPVKDAAAFAAALQRSKQENRVLLLIRDGGMQRFVALSW